jgi:CDP-glucose 4,6-dehydratase
MGCWEGAMESLEMNQSFWKGKSVLLTGHTGFKGGWLSLWLQAMGAKVHGYALAPSTQPNFFTLTNVVEGMASHTIADIRDTKKINNLIEQVKPEIVFHMAAQPLVRYSYAEPVETYAINVMGTVNLLESLRHSSSVKAVVNVTTDKCYENREWLRPYRESDALGGYDPYSNSKACSELVTASYRQSFFNQKNIGIASARAGNVIGGGDWSADRLIPDFFRAVAKGRPLIIRSPKAIRPWQHVLEPLSGYLNLAEMLYSDCVKFAGAWNFAPPESDTQTVAWILNQLIERIPDASWELDESSKPHEAVLLKLDSNKAQTFLGWTPKWSLEESLDKTVEWQSKFNEGADLKEYSKSQIISYIGEAL